MKATFAALCLGAALAFASGVSAQDPSSTNPDAKKDEKKQTMTVTGCLREAAGTTGEYELTNVTGGKGVAKSAASTYRLAPEGTVNLKEHVGHKVEITGETKTDTSTREKSPTSATSMETLKVTSLKHISPTCEAGTTR